MAQRITLDDVKAMPRDMLTPAIVGAVIGVTPYAINIMARDNPEQVPFPFLRVGNRVKVPRLAFIRWMEGQEEKAG